ncbi:hypothetical protein AAU57_11845 [Nonlabens sp. YIK11]|uniref:hypothetical protein n=1 Tax=Nonlabens sp. YIK11 TaxID=1453349 RepID=UPI0006DBFFEB|nr:hypothetical protein [Nonlabens sp. YIK11]KQC33942.1 hypothetical protein AAU57_11845 [Nonlabens sp. YIK11]
MSFFKRKTKWQWSESDEVLELKDDNLFYLLWMPLLIFIPAIISFAIHWQHGEMVETILSGTVAVPSLIVMMVWLKTTSVRNVISMDDVDRAVIKNEMLCMVSLKLTNGRYRQVSFNTESTCTAFLDLLRKHHIEIEKRTPYWSLPLNY